MLRALLLSLAKYDFFRRLVIGFALSRRVARRWVAGETLDEALNAIRRLNAKGLCATFDHLGENARSAEEAKSAGDVYLTLLDAIERHRLDSNISLKPTHMGLDFGDDVCAANLRRVLEHARRSGNFLRMDMEGSAYTERTLSIYRGLRRDGFDNVGVVIQAYLYRSAEDVRALAATGARIRLCKGAYNEPAEIAYPRKADVDENFRRLAGLMWTPEARAAGAHAALATHDEKIIRWAMTEAERLGIAQGEFEFQMLYGFRRERQAELARAGYRVRVYVPYGEQWYPYFMRRLAERPANVIFLARSLFE